MITQATKLNLIPGTVLPHINVTQYDKDSRALQFQIYNGDTRFTLTSNMTAQIQGTKPDNLGFAYDATVDTTNNIIVADLEQQMTVVDGKVTCEIVLFEGEKRIGTLNFVLMVQKAALNDETDISESELPAIVALATEQMESAAESASEAATSATNAATSESNAATSASNAATSESNASESASSAATSASQAAAWSSNPPYIGANGNWYVYDTTQQTFVDSGVASKGDTGATPDITMTASVDGTIGTPAVTVSESGTAEEPTINLTFSGLKGEKGDTGDTGATPNITMTASVNNSEGTPEVTVTETGTAESPNIDFAFKNLKGNTGNGISNIAKTSTSGLVDTYTVTFTDGTTTTFTVTNGRDGEGAGDMVQTDYDSDSSVKNAGGIAAYVTDQIEALDVSDSATAGSYVTAVSETDGVIAVTREAADTTPTASSNKMVTSDGIKTALDTKADSATTLAGYGITDAYTKTETGNQITSAINALDVTDSAVSGSYVTAVSETDGEISVTREAADTTPTASSTKMVTSGAVKTALDTKANISTISESYNASTTYAVGDIFIYNNQPYIVNVACTGITPPNANYYTAKSITELIEDANSQISNILNSYRKNLLSSQVTASHGVNAAITTSEPLSVGHLYRMDFIDGTGYSNSLLFSLSSNNVYAGVLCYTYALTEYKIIITREYIYWKQLSGSQTTTMTIIGIYRII